MLSKKDFINNLGAENSTFSTQRQAEMVANLLDTVSSDIYSESQRFVFELIQNADDAAQNTNNEIYFDFLLNSLIISHYGKAFDEGDIISLTSAGASTKRSDPTKTGYKGIGFKSVFGKSNCVTIFSNGYQFRFDKSFHKTKLPWQIIPLWTELSELNTEVQKNLINNCYSVSTIIDIQKPDELQEDLVELLKSGEIILFLRRVSKISVSSNGIPIICIEKKKISESIQFDEVVLYKDDAKISTWLLKTFEKIAIPSEIKIQLRNEEQTPEKLKEADYTELSFAAKVEEGQIKAMGKDESLIFTYLPTKCDKYNFPFLVNGSFLSIAGRLDLHEDSVWNQWLFNLTAEKIIDWLEILANSKFKKQILHLLPSFFESTQNDLKVSFDRSLKNYLKQKPFIPVKTSNFKKISEIIVDKTGLSDLSFIAPEVIVEYINKKKNVFFNSESFIDSKLQKIDKLREFDVMFFEAENLEDFFLSDTFTNNHKPVDNYRLIEYFYEKAGKDELKEWNMRLKSIPFIYSESGKLRSPKSICFPSINFKPEVGYDISVIHSDVYSDIEINSKIKSWLEFLGVKEPSDMAYIENEIIGNIENCIDSYNYLKVTRYIFNQHKKGLLNEVHYKKLQDLRIYTIKKDFSTAKECYLSDFYEPSLKLQKVNEAGSYVSELYKQAEDLISEWKTFFLKIGVSESIQKKRINWLPISEFYQHGVNIEYFNSGVEKAKSMSNYIGFPIREINSIEILSFLRFSNIYEFSKTFWVEVFKKYLPSNFSNSPFLNMGYFNGYCYIQDYNKWAFINLGIFPTTTKKCLKASEVYVNDKDIRDLAGKFLPILDYDEPLPDEWRKFLPFKLSLDLADYLTILEQIAEGVDEEPLSKIDQKRISSVYAKLCLLLPNLTNSKKEEIITWSKEGKLLIQNGLFLEPSSLFWLKGTSTYFGSELALIYIPDDLNDNNYIEELMTLFGVTIISEFKLITDNLETNDSLQNELLSISPYLSAIIERKSGDIFETIFSSLKSKIQKLIVYKTSKIELSYQYNGQQAVISKPDSYFDINNNTLYFTGNWKSPTTMYSLIEHVAKALFIERYQEELRLFLQLESDEIANWLKFKFEIDKREVEGFPVISRFLSDLVQASEEEIKASDSGILTDNSSIKTRISINEESQEIVFETLERNGFIIDTKRKITYTILEGIKNPDGKPIKVVIKSAKQGRIYFTPLEWIALAEEDSQLFVLTAGNKVRNVTLKDLQRINDEFHMRFNTEHFIISNLKIFANFFKGLPFTHFIFIAPESTTDYLQQFGLSERNPGASELTADDKNLLH